MILKVFNKYFGRSEFLKNVATLISGSMLAQMIPFFLAPVVARLYYPGDYAVLAAYTSVSVLLTIVATGMYDSALMLDATDEEAVNTASVAVTITILLSVLAGITIILFRDIIASFTGNESVTFWLYLIPLTVFFTGLYSTLSVWTNRKKRYKRLAGNKIIQTIATTSLTICLGFLGWREKGLLLSMITGQAISFLLLFSQTIKEDKALTSLIKKESIKLSLKKHIDFPKYNMPQGFLDGLRESSIILIISNNFTPAILGSYSYAVSIINRPLQIIGSAFNQIYYQKAAEISNRGEELFPLTKKMIITLVLATGPFFLMLLIFAPDIFVILFGQNWQKAGIITQILAPFFFIKLISSSISSIPMLLKKQGIFFIASIAVNILVPASMALAIMLKKDSNYTIGVFSFTYTLALIVNIIWIMSLLKKTKKD